MTLDPPAQVKCEPGRGPPCLREREAGADEACSQLEGAPLQFCPRSAYELATDQREGRPRASACSRRTASIAPLTAASSETSSQGELASAKIWSWASPCWNPRVSTTKPWRVVTCSSSRRRGSDTQSSIHGPACDQREPARTSAFRSSSGRLLDTGAPSARRDAGCSVTCSGPEVGLGAGAVGDGEAQAVDRAGAPEDHGTLPDLARNGDTALRTAFVRHERLEPMPHAHGHLSATVVAAGSRRADADLRALSLRKPHRHRRARAPHVGLSPPPLDTPTQPTASIRPFILPE